MGRLDWYILRQLLASFGFFALVLVLIYWVNRAVRLFDQLISDGQSALVFLEFTLLTLPSIISSVTPIAVFVAAVFVTNRLASDSELVVVHATGFSARRLTRPFFAFGVFIAVLMLGLTHWVVPQSRDQLNIRQAEVAENLTARLLTEGTFLSPTKGVTFYLKEISPQGELLNVFLDDARKPDRHMTYSAGSAFLVKTDTGPKLVMIDGLIQIADDTTNQLTLTRFNDFVFDIGGLMSAPIARSGSLKLRTSFELADLLKTGSDDPKQNADLIWFELQNRSMTALLSVVTALIGFAALVVAGFSRFGIWPQVFVAAMVLVFVKMVESAVTRFVLKEAASPLLLYIPVGVGIIIATLFLMRKDRVLGSFLRRAAT